MIRAIAALLLGLLFCLAATTGVLAHAGLLSASPADGAVLPTPPERLTLTFNEPVAPLVLKLIRPGGEAVGLDRVSRRGALLDIEAPAGLGSGTHILSWRVISEDGHPAAGSMLFSIGQAGEAAAGVEATDPLVQAAIWVARMALYLALFIGIGGAFFRAWIAPGSEAARPLTAVLLFCGGVAALFSVGLQGLDALAQPLSALHLRTVWRTGFATTQGSSVSIALPALCLGFLSLSVPSPVIARALSLGALLGVGATLAASGHAATAAPQWLTRPAVFIHGVGIAFWIGALAPLAALLVSAPAAARPALDRFSRHIPAVLALLVLAGLVLALVQLDRPGDLWTTAYGRILSVKLLLLLLLLGLAALNRVRLSVDPASTHPLQRSILLEIALVIGIFAAVGLWRFTPPPRVLAAAAAAQPVSIHIHTDRAMADLRLTPGRVGPVTASIDLMTGDIEALAAKEVTLVLAPPGAGIEPIARPARRMEDGSWAVGGLSLPLSGRWSVRIDILVSDFELLKLADTIEIRP